MTKKGEENPSINRAPRRCQYVIASVRTAIFILLLTLGAIGCGRKAVQTAAPQSAPITVSAAAQPAQIQSQASPLIKNGEPDLTEINRAMVRWLVRNQRRPASFADFAATADAPIPPAPAGKKYVLAPNMHVQLVSQ